MSLEDALKENTATMKQLIAALGSYRVTPNAFEAAKVVPNTPSGVSPKGDAEPKDTPAFNYDDHVKKPFLQLLNTKREAAMKLLADLGVNNLKGFENQPEKFAEISQKIQEAQNG